MPRTIDVTVPEAETARVMDMLRSVGGVLGISVQPQASKRPPGDVLTIQATNDGSREVLRQLGDLDLARHGSIVTSEPLSVLNADHATALEKEGNETTWDEMAFLLRRETNLSFNYLALMFVSGNIAAVALWTDHVHLAIGAMVVAPGFVPILRIPFGLIAGPMKLALHGVLSMLGGYVTLAIGAAMTTLLLSAMSETASPLTARTWVQYWTTVTGSGVWLGLIGGAAGAVVIAAQRSELTAGVMITLALIPSMAIVGMSVVSGNYGLAELALTRWVVDVAMVLVASSLVLLGKQRFVHRRRIRRQ